LGFKINKKDYNRIFQSQKYHNTINKNIKKRRFPTSLKVEWEPRSGQHCWKSHEFAPRGSTKESNPNRIMPRRQDNVSEANGLNIKVKIN